jgi:hypothetical protein
VTDSHAGYIVTLKENIREDDAGAVINALRMVKGVASVTPIMGSYDQHLAQQRRDMLWEQSLLELARNGPEGPRP